MIREITIGMWTATIALLAAFTGCSAEQKSEPAAATAQPSAQQAAGQNAGAAAADENAQADEARSEINEALANLSPEDRALAEKQKICPVTDEPLGSMGAPIKVVVEGREVFVCCEGCVDELKNNFAKYDDKLPEQS
ncbi:MAG TPA: hypothetical protein VF175_11560 [Lacipirellula sp.]